MQSPQGFRKRAPRLLLVFTALMALSAVLAAPVVTAQDHTAYTAQQIEDWLIGKVANAKLNVTEADSVSLNRGSQYMEVSGVELELFGVEVGLSPIRFNFKELEGQPSKEIDITATLALFDTGPAPRMKCTATVECEGPSGPVKVSHISNIEVSAFEPDLSASDIDKIMDVINQVIGASGLSVSGPSGATLTGMAVVDDGEKKLQLTWSDDSETLLAADSIKSKINGMIDTLEIKANDYLAAAETERGWWIDVSIPGTSLDIDAGLTAFGVTTAVSGMEIEFDKLSASVTDAIFSIGTATKEITVSATADVGCSEHKPTLSMTSLSVGGEYEGFNEFISQFEEALLDAINQAVSNIVEDTDLTWPFCPASIAIEGETVVLREGDKEPYLVVGDVNLDGRTNIIDAMFIAQYVVGLRTLDVDQIKCADTTADSAVNIIDAMHIAQFTVDPRSTAGILFKPLFDPVFHQGMIDPLTLL